MPLYSTIAELPPGPCPIFALGFFDGVHRGHQQLLQAAQSWAQQIGGRACALSLDRHPASLLAPEKAPKLLMATHQKARIITQMGLDLVVLEFDHQISSMEPREFVEKILVDQLKVKGLVVGFDYSFGRKAQGTPELLAQWGEEYGYQVQIIPEYRHQGEVVSSSAIRQQIQAGQIDQANRLLGHPYSLRGIVVEGERRGRTLGFPTANLALDEQLLFPADGVYTVKVHYGGREWMGVLSIGPKVTFGGVDRSIEVWLQDFSGNLYGEILEVDFYQRIRGMVKFETADELVAQIHADACEARRYFKS